jgi:hypothetical protein
MKLIVYILLNIMPVFSLIAGEIPSIYRCYGGYSSPVVAPPDNFCAQINSIENNEKLRQKIENGTAKYDLTQLKCRESTLKVIAPYLNRVIAESKDETVFSNLGKFKKFINLDFMVDGSRVNLGAVAAICGYSDNLRSIINIGGKAKANFRLKVQTRNGVIERNFSLLEGLDFNDAINSNYQSMSLQQEIETYEKIEAFLQ